jgi:membrane protease YdiL (CAAX protease family)
MKNEHKDNGDNRKTLYSVIIFVVGTYILSAIGGYLMYNQNELGGLLFILSPILMTIFVRLTFKLGWKNAGLKLNFKKNYKFYLFGLVAYPLTFLITILLGFLFGTVTTELSFDKLVIAILIGISAQIIPRTIYAFFEEFSWRGFLEPQLQEIVPVNLKRYLIVGLIWAFWHFPLILCTPFTTIPYIIFLPTFIIGVLVATVTYGEIRRITNSIWPLVILHGIANIIAYAIVMNGMFKINNLIISDISIASLTTIVIWAIIAYLFIRKSK